MAKGDDVKMRKKNKANRKKLQKDSSSVSARVAAFIAAKKRRQSGKRRQCQGMCFSLPSPEDPFNDGHGKPDYTMKKVKKRPQSNDKRQERRKNDGNTDEHKAKKLKQMGLENQQRGCVDNPEKVKNAEIVKGKVEHLAKGVVPDELEAWKSGDSGCPSKFLLMCLSSIQDSLLGDGELSKEQGEPLFANSWGVKFWYSYSLGHDVLEKSRTSASVEQIAWMASSAADSISRMEKEGVSFRSPFLLFLVPSQEKAVKVRSVCKPLKASGIHTVILHPRTSVKHQIDGLKKCEPEFLVATPERLWELISLKAVDISAVSLLVVDAIDSFSNCLDVIEHIKDSIPGDHRTIVFQGSCSGSSVQVQNILREPFHTLSFGESINSRGIGS